MAKLHELAPAYYAAADRLTDKIRELELDMKDADPMRRGRLLSRVNQYKQVRVQVRKTAKLCEHYYEGGFYRDTCDYRPASSVPRIARKPAGVGAGTEGAERGRKRRELGALEVKPETGHRERTDGPSAEVLVDVLLRGVDNGRNRRKGRRKQVHRVPDDTAGQKTP